MLHFILEIRHFWMTSRKFWNTLPRPLVSVDLSIFTVLNGSLCVLLVKRKFAPFKGKWALPGGFVMIDETLDDAAERELQEETGITNVYIEQLRTFGEVSRDPRTRVITVGYFALIDSTKAKLTPATDASDAQWFSVSDIQSLAFDHLAILHEAINRIRRKIAYTNIIYTLLPHHFTLTQMQEIYEAILKKTVDKRNFRKKVLSLGLLKTTSRKAMEGSHRPAQLFQFKHRTLKKINIF